MNDLISIIIPVFNVKNYITNTINSVLAQNYPNFEIIIVDDGSTDGTAEILEQFMTSFDRIQVIHIPNGGVSNARLTGVKAARGDWIGFVDGDDQIAPDMYEILMRNAKMYDADISHCGYDMVFPSRVDHYYNTKKVILQDHLTGLRDLLSAELIEPGLWNKLYKRSLFEKLLQTNVMDLSIKINEDLLMNFYLFREAQRSIFEDICLYRYIVRSGSAANASLNQNLLLDPVRVTKIIIRETEKEAELNYIIEARLIRQLIALSTMSLGVQSSLIGPIRKSARKELKSLLRNESVRSHLNQKLKLMAHFADTLPSAYRFVHSVYLKLTGLDKKYEIN